MFISVSACDHSRVFFSVTHSALQAHVRSSLGDRAPTISPLRHAKRTAFASYIVLADGWMLVVYFQSLVVINDVHDWAIT